MAKPKTLVLRTAGTNCDNETVYAFKTAGAEVTLSHINDCLNGNTVISEYNIIAIPGGFSYGDDIASGKILANEIKHSLKEELSKFIQDGKIIIGICNGFQVLVKMGLLPGPGVRGTGHVARVQEQVTATLSNNDSGKFEARWVYLKRENIEHDKCIWTQDLQPIIYLPVAHGEGKFIPQNEEILNNLKTERQIVLRYTSGDGKSGDYPFNPNGSIYDIAGICDTTGRIFGLMPHPERHISVFQHPNWRRRVIPAQAGIHNKIGDGLHIFKNGVNFVKKSI